MLDNIDNLRQVQLFTQLTDEQLYWLSKHGSYIRLQPGDKVVTEGEPADYFFVLLKGELQLTKNVRSQEIYLHTKEVGKGTGLGLDIARRIVVGQHKGDIRVFSKPGDTHFQVRLPMNPAKTV